MRKQLCRHRASRLDPERTSCSEMCSSAVVTWFSRLIPSFIVFFLAAKPALCVTVEELYSFGWDAGDRRLRPSDDGYSQALALQTSFPFFDKKQGILHLNNNGILSFNRPVSGYSPEPFPLSSNLGVVAPYWSDVDTSGTGTVWYRQTTDKKVLERAQYDVTKNPTLFPVLDLGNFSPSMVFIATWDHVGYYNRRTDKTNTFQCVLITDGDVSFVLFLYADIQWTTAEGILGLDSSPALVGFNAGDRVRSLSVPGSQTSATLELDVTNGNTGERGLWIFRVDEESFTIPGDCAGPLRVVPPYGNMLGGAAVRVLGPCFDESDIILCRFGSEVEETAGVYVNKGQASCISPMLSRTGNVGFELTVLSKDGQTSYESDHVPFYSLHFLSANEVTFTGKDLTVWKGKSLSITWKPNHVFPLEEPELYTIDISLYRLTEDYQWVFQTLLAENITNTGHTNGSFPDLHQSNTGLPEIFPFTLKLTTSVLLMNSSRTKDAFQNLSQLPGIWSSVAVYSVADLFSHNECNNWVSDVTSRQNELLSIDSLPPCPCTIEQAQVPNSGLTQQTSKTRLPHELNGDRETECYYSSTLKFNRMSARQCCYDTRGLLVPGPSGGHADYFSPWAPGVSENEAYWQHFSHDVLPFLHCCKAEVRTCDVFYYHRPSTVTGNSDQCQSEAPVPACVYGDPHIITLDGHTYTFNGKGEFTLIETNDGCFTLQGRMIEAQDVTGNNAAATVFSAIVAKQIDSDIIQFETSRRGLDVFINGKQFEFGGPKLIHLKNITLSSHGDGTYGVAFSCGAYIEVEEHLGAISPLLVSLSRDLENQTQGLMGTFNGMKWDDLLPRGTTMPLPLKSSLQIIHEGFGLSWVIYNPQDSLFTYRPGEEWVSFFSPGFSAEFEPTFSSSSMEQHAQLVCRGDQFCLFDIAATGRYEVGEHTQQISRRIQKFRTLSSKVSCNPPCRHGVCVENDTCSCPEGYTGKLCETTLLREECKENICKNGGTCQLIGSDHVCLCPPGSKGFTCEQVRPLELSCRRKVIGETLIVTQCVSNNQLANTLCSTNGGTLEFCTFPLAIDITLFPFGTHSVLIKATDVFNFTRESVIHYTKPKLALHFINSSPRPTGNLMIADFTVNRPGVTLTCFVTNQRRKDCSLGTVIYRNLDPGEYTLRVVARAANGEASRIRRKFYAGDRCLLNLINEGVVVSGNSVHIQFSGSRDVRSFRCKLDDCSFLHCRSPVHHYDLSRGDHRFQVIPVGCTGLRHKITEFFAIH